MSTDEQKQTQKMAYVYKIESVDGSVRYIGSTKNRLCSRMAAHRNQYKQWKAGHYLRRCTAYDVFDKCGVENCGIYVLEEIPFTTTLALHQLERKWILELECVNKNIPARTPEERVELLAQRSRSFLQRNPGYMKKWLEAHPGYSSKWGKQLTTCECGTTIKRHSMRTHLLSAKHDHLMEKKSSPSKVVELPK